MQFWDNNDNDENRSSGGGNPPPNWRKWVSPGLLVLVMLLALVSSPGLLGGISSSTEIAYSVVYEQALQQNVALFDFHGETSVHGQFRRSVILTAGSGRSQEISRFKADIPPYGGAELLELAQEQGIDIRATPNETSILLTLLINLLPLALIIGFFVWMGRRAQGQMNGIFSFGQSQAREKSPEMPSINFEDVAGQDAAKMELEEVVDFLKQPEK